MREIIVRVPAGRLEEVLDRLLLIVPAGVQELPAGKDVELRMRGAGLPPIAEVERLVRPWRETLTERQVPDDWRERRLADYVPEVVAQRLVVRPDWAPPAGPGLIDVSLADDLAFGSGAHPTTRTILELMLSAPPLGAFADLGCGSGVIAILAAKLGWAPVTGIELIPGSAESARGNAARNGVQVEVEVADLVQHAPPVADGFVANMPAPVHAVVAAAPAMLEASWGVISGFGPRDAPALIEAYAAAGLEVDRNDDLHGWSVIVLERRS